MKIKRKKGINLASLNLLKEALNSIQEKLSNIYDEILIEIRKKEWNLLRDRIQRWHLSMRIY